MFQKLIELGKSFNFFKSGGCWFVLVLVLSVLIRLYMVIFTDGTYDIEIWQGHAQEIQRLGLIEYYRISLGSFNHPPVAGYFASFCLSLSMWSTIPFKILFRLSITLQDFLIAFYLMKIFANNKYRYIYTAFYLLCPITFIFSAYHGNTDSIVGLFCIACLYYASNNKYIIAGILLGAGTWVKWIAVLILPVLFLNVTFLKNKTRFLISFGVTFVVGYLWILVQAPDVVFKSVFGYGGQMIQTTAGIPVWGNRILYAYIVNAYFKIFSFPSLEYFIKLINICIVNNSAIIFGAVILYSWLRRNRKSVLDIGRTIGEVYCIFYGVTNFWSFQYFAWAIPFWLFLNIRLTFVIFFFTTMYIYLLYSFVCGSYFLLGKWDFIGHPYLSGVVLFFKDSCILLFMIITVYLFGKACWDKVCFSKTEPENTFLL